MAGLRANQVGLSLVSSNVANAETPGYARKTITQIQTVAGETGAGVRTVGVNRELDQYIQRQVRTETAGASYADIRANFLSRLQGIYGDPGSAGTIESAFNSLTTAVQGLSTSPDSTAARNAVISAAQSLAQQLNSTSAGIQTLRSDAESAINNSINTANNAMEQIASINRQLLGTSGNDAAAASLLDQRDQYVTQLSQMMDIRVSTNESNQISVFTNSGVQLVGVEAAKLAFNAQGTVTPNTLWSSDPTKSNVGSITINFPHGGTLNLVSSNSIRSGQIAAYLELRDKTLVQAQTQIDQFAAALSSSLSDMTTAGTVVTSAAPQAGFDLDTTGLRNGNSVQFTYTDTTTGQTRNVTVIRVDDPTALPLKNTATINPNDEVIGIDFSGGMASVVSQLNAAFASADIQFSNPGGSTLRILDDGAGNRSDINSASVTTTLTSLTSGNAQLPLFNDGGTPYSGIISGTGTQQIGLAGRLTVNTALLGDPSRLIVYSTSPLTASGDTKRSDFILAQLTTGSYYYSPQTGIGSSGAPFKGTLLNFTQQFISAQGEAASSAQQISDGQGVVLATLQKKLDATSAVNIDEEMAHLLALQNAYAANARVMSTVKDMFAALLQVL